MLCVDIMAPVVAARSGTNAPAITVATADFAGNPPRQFSFLGLRLQHGDQVKAVATWQVWIRT